ncbi:Hermansky-Pudlak syndrome 6 protein-like protein [Trichoplax sp. H2]|nr:Hermansky-Pudlak syndrome 6 protein-like protein [Trichoplax sp. H2]|eukprot:RDD44494.1 Hermansky-Pudlak syndrome 6 protein-like protein [Trichoplax sp. H2]
MFQVTPLQNNFPYIKGHKDFYQMFADGDDDIVITSFTMWSTPGHFYTLINGDSFYAFDIIGKNGCKELQRLHSLPADSETAKILHSAKLVIPCKKSPVVGVCYHNEDPQQIYIVHQNGDTELWKYTLVGRNYCWKNTGTYTLCTSTRTSVSSVMIHSQLDTIIWCERRRSGQIGDEDCCICTRKLDRSNDAVKFGTASVILHHCPDIDIYPHKDGIYIVAKQPCDLILFSNVDATNTFLLHLWNKDTFDTSHIKESDYRAIIDHYSYAWINDSTVSKILDVMVDLDTQRIYIIDSACGVSLLTYEQGDLEISYLYSINLADADVKKVVNGKHRLQGFILNLFLGIISHNGQIRMYEINSGILTWTSDSFPSPHDTIFQLWKYNSPISHVGVYLLGLGIFILENVDIAKQAQQLERVVSEGENLENFQLNLAIKHSMLWSRYQLAYRQVINFISKATNTAKSFSLALETKISKETIQECLRSSPYSPTLILASLLQYPPTVYDFTYNYIENYVEYYQSVLATTAEPVKKQRNFLLDMVPVFENYLNIVREHRKIISGVEDAIPKEDVEIDLPNIVKDMLIEIYTGPSTSNEVALYQDIDAVCTSSVTSFIQGYLLYLGMKIGHDGSSIKIIEENENWKSLLDCDVIHEEAELELYKKSSIFRTFCRVLYRESATALVPLLKILHEKFKSMEDTFSYSQRKNIFSEIRAVLPSLHPCRIEETTSEMISAYTELTLLSEDDFCENMALRTFIFYSKWEDAIAFTSSYNNNTLIQKELFHILITEMLKAGILNVYSKLLWNAIPQDMSLIALLTLLNDHLCPRSLTVNQGNVYYVQNNKDVSIGAVKDQFKKMLSADLERK